MNDSILFWNAVAIEAARIDFTINPTSGRLEPQQPGPTATSRALAIVHLAMFDAYMGATGASTYLTHASGDLPSPSGVAVARVAVSSAACMTLGQLFSRQAAAFVRQHTDFVAALGAGDAEVTEGLRWGALVAQRMMDARANDGAATANMAMYAPSPDPYRHRADPMAPDQGYLGARWGEVTPFLISDLLANTTVKMEPPPALTDQRYADDYNAVKAQGRASGSTRTPDQTAIGIFWAYDGALNIGVPPRLYNQAVRAMCQAATASESTNAKLFAAVNAGMADAGILAWFEKYKYNIWRPVVGIREADRGWGPTGRGDGNTGTSGDPDWTPLGAPRSNTAAVEGFTPSFPAYPSGHATFGTVALRLAQHVLGVADDFRFSFVSEELNGRTTGARGVRPLHARTMTVDQAIEENILSRVYLGVHWEFDGREGESIGEQLAKAIGTLPLFA